jgi:hypothetical protein
MVNASLGNSPLPSSSSRALGHPRSQMLQDRAEALLQSHSRLAHRLNLGSLLDHTLARQERIGGFDDGIRIKLPNNMPFQQAHMASLHTNPLLANPKKASQVRQDPLRALIIGPREQLNLCSKLLPHAWSFKNREQDYGDSLGRKKGQGYPLALVHLQAKQVAQIRARHKNQGNQPCFFQ